MNRDKDTQLIWESYPNADFSDIIYRVDLYNGNSQMVLMSPEIAEELKHLDGPKKGGATVWMAEEYLYLKPNKT